MVGLGLIDPPVQKPLLQITLTKRGEKIYDLVRNLPTFQITP